MAKQRNPQKTQWRYTFNPRTADKLNVLCKTKDRNGNEKYNNNETLVVETAIDVLYYIEANPRIKELLELKREDGTYLYNDGTMLMERALDWLYEMYRTDSIDISGL